VFTITNNDLRNALHNAHKRGVKVRVISDDECMKQIGSDVYTLKTYGIDVESDTNPDAHMHNKFVVIDNYIIITGSFNWTSSAVEKNNENLMVLGCTELAEKYKAYFEELWAKFASAKIDMQDAREHVAE
jgi:cardiolipin hydrolase